MSKSTLDQFIAKVKNEGLLLGSHFYVIMTPPFSWEADPRDVMMMCDSINLPSQTVGTSDVRVFGENREHVYMPLYGTINASFIVDRNMRVKTFFEQWMAQSVDKVTRTVGYYYDFVSTVEIYVTDKDSKVVHAVRCYEVFPKSITELRLDYSSAEVLRLNVEFSMKYWDSIPVNESGDENSNQDPKARSLQRTLKRFTREEIESIGVVGIGEAIGSSLGFKAEGSYGLSGNFVKDIIGIGGAFGSDGNRALSGVSALLQTSPSGNSLTKSLADGLSSLGNATGTFGTALAGIGEGIRNVVAPAGALANATLGVANVLNTINTTTSALGLGTPFAGAASSLSNVAGKLAVVSNAGGLPGNLSTVGAAMGAVGGGFQSITESIKGIPGGTAKIADSISNIGNIFNSNGNKIQQSSSTLSDGVKEGKYT